ncbi:CobW family GTP-binding protein [Shimia aestuarii]|uniref:Cobalamin synthesis protein cobW C-terminal domain-containing protein n=1 Tax=Shimia aestuarii TaxID=254406 RepID=A0A1I4SLT1_9RHOB|nr:GTP-binding protein [Shimia aestuarii]SFM65446.1 Cobalamin synthesis protein cobW C-terminal domain-containing protein [Shimia aestuarii]
MSVPILLVTGFLGSGKTTFINGLLHIEHGKRIAAIVNDFGAINIDEALLESATDEVIGLKNGCICCSLQGDLLRTLKQVLVGAAPDLIVIEASGVSDPQGIIDAVMDPVLWPALLLDSVICVVDVPDMILTAERAADPLWLAQVMAADIIQFSKVDGLASSDLSKVTMRLRAMGKSGFVGLDADNGSLSALLGFGRAEPRGAGRATVQSAERFATLEWRSDAPIPMAAFQNAIASISPKVLRAKGLVSFVEKPSTQLVFQLVGQRATLAPHTEDGVGCALVFIGEKNQFDPETTRAVLDAMVL